jgi:hypothetical protein
MDAGRLSEGQDVFIDDYKTADGGCIAAESSAPIPLFIRSNRQEAIEVIHARREHDSTGPVPSPSDAAGLSGTRIAQARRGAVIMEYRLAAQNSDTPQLHLRRRRCTSTHRKAPVGPGSQRSGPGSPRRHPATAGRLQRSPPISPREWRVGRKCLTVSRSALRVPQANRGTPGRKTFLSRFTN